MGLLSFDLTKKHVKTTRIEDTVFYIKQRISFMDTKISKKGWTKITPNINYERKMFHLTDLEEVNKYWHQLRDTCIKTPLGMSSEKVGFVRKKRSKVELNNQKEKFEIIKKRSKRMQKGLSPSNSDLEEEEKILKQNSSESTSSTVSTGLNRTLTEDKVNQLTYDAHWPVTRLNSWFETEWGTSTNSHKDGNQVQKDPAVTSKPVDDGLYIPGDGLGAGGLDTSLFAHKKSNWLPKENRNKDMHLFLNTSNPSFNENSNSKNLKLYDKESRDIANDLEVYRNLKNQKSEPKPVASQPLPETSSFMEVDEDDYNPPTPPGPNSQPDDFKASPLTTRFDDRIDENDLTLQKKIQADKDSKRRKQKAMSDEQKQLLKQNEDAAKRKLLKRKKQREYNAKLAKDNKHGQRCKFQEDEDMIISRLQAVNTFLFRLFKKFAPKILREKENKDFVTRFIFQDIFYKYIQKLIDTNESHFSADFGKDKSSEALLRRRNVIFSESQTKNKSDLRILHDKIVTALNEDTILRAKIFAEAEIDDYHNPVNTKFYNLSKSEQQVILNDIFEQVCNKVLNEWPIDKLSPWEKRILPSITRINSQYDDVDSSEETYGNFSPAKKIKLSQNTHFTDHETQFFWEKIFSKSKNLKTLVKKLNFYFGSQKVQFNTELLNFQNITSLEHKINKLDNDYGFMYSEVKYLFNHSPDYLQNMKEQELTKLNKTEWKKLNSVSMSNISSINSIKKFTIFAAFYSFFAAQEKCRFRDESHEYFKKMFDKKCRNDKIFNNFKILDLLNQSGIVKKIQTVGSQFNPDIFRHFNRSRDSYQLPMNENFSKLLEWNYLLSSKFNFEGEEYVLDKIPNLWYEMVAFSGNLLIKSIMDEKKSLVAPKNLITVKIDCIENLEENQLPAISPSDSQSSSLHLNFEEKDSKDKEKEDNEDNEKLPDFKITVCLENFKSLFKHQLENDSEYLKVLSDNENNYFSNLSENECKKICKGLNKDQNKLLTLIRSKTNIGATYRSLISMSFIKVWMGFEERTLKFDIHS